MLHQSTNHFGPVQMALAGAMHASGSTDTEIGLALGVSVNNIIHWRRGEGLRENVPAGSEPYTPPVRREAAIVPQSAGQSTAPLPGLKTHAEAMATHLGPVQPEGDSALEIGTHMDAKAYVDLEELLTTRLLIQGNSGSGKTHLLRRLLEECAGIVQQVIIDPEGDFVSFGEAFGHTVIEASMHQTGKLTSIAAKTRQLRGSVVLSLEGLEIDGQMKAVSAFLTGLFEAPSQYWHPMIVAVDEAHLFAPATDNGEDRETRRESQQAMANLMCRGRKRGLAGIIATQRLSKLHKNVAAEASNFLLGRTFLDIDLARAADLLGMATKQVEEIRALSRGEFLGLGPAIARRSMKIKVGDVMTQGKAGAEKGITPLPSIKPEDMQSLLLADDEPVDEPAAGPERRAPALRVVAS